MNVPPIIGMVLSRDSSPTMALERLNTILSVEDVHDIIEVILIDGANNRILQKIEDSRRREDS